MRFAAYAGTSMVLATGVLLRALHQRANFYSACVYLAQSNACLMILTNIALLGVSTLIIGLQRLFYGQLRPVEMEQLYERGWYAATEICLAMTIFREEVGFVFLAMFVCLLIGKIWIWIGEGRVEALEQQPPANPRLFHARLSISLIISIMFDIFILNYSIDTVLRHARPNMMVMFAFEFAVLTVTSLSTAARYLISLHEATVIEKQRKDRLTQMRRDQGEARSSAPTVGASTGSETAANGVAAEDDIDSLDIDVPGWEEKGRWVFYLDLTTDFLKLILYLTFFCVLCMFYGMPIHIIRDVALTIRSFYKRIADFVRYRQATRDMNARYPDATPEEIAREDVCIICRETMRPWSQPVNDADASRIAIDERLRSKRLPCGHILHFACLRSWLERQQNCPTCRRPVLVPTTVARTPARNFENQQAGGMPPPNAAQAQGLGHGNGQQPGQAQNVFQFGRLRIAIGAGHMNQELPQQFNNIPANQQGHVPAVPNIPQTGNAFGFPHAPGFQARTVTNFSATNLTLQLHQIEQQIIREISGLRVQADQLYMVRALQGETARLRIAQANLSSMPGATSGSEISTPNQQRVLNPLTQITQGLPNGQAFTAAQQSQSIGSGHPNLPAGMTLPEGWTVLPLQRLSGGAGLSPVGASPATTPPGGIFNPTTSSSIDIPSVNIPHASPTTTASTGEEPSIPWAGDNHGGGTHKSVSDPSIPGALVSGDVVVANEQAIASSQRSSASKGVSALPPSAIPQWGSANGSSESTQDQEAKVSEDSQPDGPSGGKMQASDEDVVSASSSKLNVMKGKGKATTVEDSGDLD